MKRWAITVGLLAAVAIAPACVSCSKPSDRGSRVMVLGIDGATWTIIEPMMAAGELPNIKKLYDQGLHGILQSRPPILSPVVWTTIFTGFNYKTHGVTDWKTSQSTNRRVSAIWNIATARDKRTNVFNVPGSWPPEPVSGVMLSGFPLSGSTFAGNTGEVLATAKLEIGRVMTPYRDNAGEIMAAVAELAVGQWTPWFAGKVASRPSFKGMMRAMRLSPDKIYVSPLYRTDDGIVMSEPHDLRSKLTAKLGEPYIPEGPGWSRWEEPDTPVYLYQHLEQVFDIQTRAALEYAAGDWDLSLYVMTLVDRVSHPYWAYSHPDDYPEIDREKARLYESAVADSYRASDEALGRILDAAKGEFYVVVVSDHGFNSYEDRSKEVGGHNPDGIYMVSGPGIKPGDGERAYIEDVTPTLLYLLGLPVGQDMDGKPIAEVTADLGRRLETIASYERGAREASDMPVDDATWEQLRGLGYVDGAPPREKMQPPPAGHEPQQPPAGEQMQQRQRQQGGAEPNGARVMPRDGAPNGGRIAPPDPTGAMPPPEDAPRPPATVVEPEVPTKH
ncbi:MAG: alkaline phosphatase family protein [Deltaproteobacteria bacterium]|nr:alkaline phosphatase family protein [Deltaproteobacteria bacterium]